MASGKRKRNRRGPGVDVARTQRIKENRKRIHKLRGNNGPRRSYGEPTFDKHVHRDPEAKIYTLEDEYKTFRRTRGHRGLNPDPEKRQDENPMCYMRNHVVNGTTRFFPIGECLSRPIRRSNDQ